MPDQTAAPDQTIIPGQTIVPGQTAAPDQTIVPDQTIAPAQTIAPDQPIAPDKPIVPAQTIAPAQGVAPDQPSVPDQPTPPAAPATWEPPASPAALAPAAFGGESETPVSELPVAPASDSLAAPADGSEPFAEPPHLRSQGGGARAERVPSIRPVPIVLPVPVPDSPAPAPASATPAESAAPAAFDDDVEATVVVQRNRGPRRVLVLDDGRTFALSATSIVIGRNPVGDPGEQRLAIPDKTRTLSKTHARLIVQGDEWRLTDLHSTNGVVVVADDGAETLLDPGESVTGAGRFVLGEVGMHVAVESGS